LQKAFFEVVMGLENSNRPDIPKRFAARIRAAQERVKQARESIAIGEYNIAQSRKRLAEFDGDPDAFASRHYGANSVDSYPVQTTINREGERLAYNERRRIERISELAEMEAALRRVEEEVLAQVAKMRPTPGRVRWPSQLPSFQQYRCDFDHETERLRLQSEVDRAKNDAEFELLVRQEERLFEESRQLQELERRAEFAALSPEDQEKVRDQGARIVADLKSGKITMQDILNAVARTR
jgi:hypothetical protein